MTAPKTAAERAATPRPKRKQGGFKVDVTDEQMQALQKVQNSGKLTCKQLAQIAFDNGVTDLEKNPADAIMRGLGLGGKR